MIVTAVAACRGNCGALKCKRPVLRWRYDRVLSTRRIHGILARRVQTILHGLVSGLFSRSHPRSAVGRAFDLCRGVPDDVCCVVSVDIRRVVSIDVCRIVSDLLRLIRHELRTCGVLRDVPDAASDDAARCRLAILAPLAQAVWCKPRMSNRADAPPVALATTAVALARQSLYPMGQS